MRLSIIGLCVAPGVLIQFLLIQKLSIRYWDTHLVTDSMWLESEQRFEYVPDKDSRVYTPAEFTLNYYRGTNMDGRLVLSSMNKKKVVYFKRIEPNQIWGIEIP